ncbi:MAG: HAD family hydrolase, partial [Saprospiraceae bacterium]
MKSWCLLTAFCKKVWRALITASLLSGDTPAERSRLEHLFAKGANLKFRQSPQDKLHFIQSLQDNGHQVLMLGDGLNDAGALRQSYAGIVLTEDSNN